MSIDVTDNTNTTALMIASEIGNAHIVQILLDRNSTIDLQNNNDDTALLLACKNGHVRIVDLLLKRSAKRNLQNKQGLSPLMAVFFNKSLSPEVRSNISSKLLSRGTDINKVTNERYNALILASQQGSIDAVHALLDYEACKVNHTNRMNQNSLMVASANGHFEIITLLLQHTADANAQDLHGWTALMLAATYGHKKVVNTLLEPQWKVNISAVNVLGQTALIIASQNGYHEIVEMLINRNAAVNLQDVNGFSALMLSCLHEDLILKYIHHTIQREDVCCKELSTSRTQKQICCDGWNPLRKCQMKLCCGLWTLDNPYVLPSEVIAFQSSYILLNDHAMDISEEEQYLLTLPQRKYFSHTKKKCDKSKECPEASILDEFESLLKERVKDYQHFRRHMQKTISRIIGRDCNDGSMISHLLSENKVNHKKTIQALLDGGADVNLQNLYGWSALMFASAVGDSNVVESLLRHDHASSTVNLSNKYGWSALIIASLNGHNNVTRILLEHGAQINHTDNFNFSALMGASETETINELLKGRINMNIMNHKGSTALMLASKRGDLQKVKTLLRHGANVNLKDSKGWSALMIAIIQGHTQIAKALLDFNADINERTVNGSSPLMIATHHGHSNITKLLLTYNASKTIQDSKGQSALMIASEKGYLRIIEQLLDQNRTEDVSTRQAHINLQNKMGESALILAALKGYMEVVQHLVVNNASVNLLTKQKKTALMAVCSIKDDHTSDALLSVVNDILSSLFNPYKLRDATDSTRAEVARILLASGARINVRDVRGFSALMIASESGQLECVKLLLENGADIDSTNKEGETASEIANKNGNTEVVTLLEQWND